MAFTDDLARHVEQIRGRIDHVRNNEQATKQALVVPLLQVLGYDVFDPREVRPEYVADFAVKKAGQFEKVDYAVFLEGQPALFIECKAFGAELADHDGQLSRYFNATPSVRVAIITDGVQLRVFTDLRAANVMDQTPWLAIDLRSMKPAEIDALRRFRRADFVPGDIVGLAEEMVYYNAMVEFLSRQLREPSEGFVRFVAGEIQAAGRVTGRIVERLSPILRKAIQASILEHVARSFDAPPPEPATPPLVDPIPGPATGSEGSRDGVVTTVEELQIFETLSGWIREIVPGAKLALRDSKSYASVHQENVRKWFVRFGADKKPWWIVLRSVAPEELRRLAPGVDVSEGGHPGSSNASLQTIADLVKLRAALILAYQREAERKSDAGASDEA